MRAHFGDDESRSCQSIHIGRINIDPEGVAVGPSGRLGNVGSSPLA